jgi:hypothetical protein
VQINFPTARYVVLYSVINARFIRVAVTGIYNTKLNLNEKALGTIVIKTKNVGKIIVS